MTRTDRTWLLFVVALLTIYLAAAATLAGSFGPPIKQLAFRDPNTPYAYRISSYNASVIRISRYALDQPLAAENIQTINFYSTLVDFDIHCEPTHCYMVCLTTRKRSNVELYSWQRTQFDLQAKRNSFARPNSVKIFQIENKFYVAIAQEQLHLSPNRNLQDIEHDSPRFIGCAILRFSRNHEKQIGYHQFIRLPFNPLHVSFLISSTPQDVEYYLVFGVEQSYNQISSAPYIWSPVNGYFWPHRFPRDVEVSPKPKSTNYIIKFPDEIRRVNLTTTQLDAQQAGGPVESCFNQLQRLLAFREHQARSLIESSQNVWRAHMSNELNSATEPTGAELGTLTDISAQVIVHGNVIVRGPLIESPQISLIGRSLRPTAERVSNVVNTHSPVLVENKLQQANYKLRHVRNKLSKAVIANLPQNEQSFINSPVRFIGPVRAGGVQLGNVMNSNVRLNGIPFKQLEHELVNINGPQNVNAKIKFTGKVFADFLEIHGHVNNRYFMKDAIDYTSNHVQVIEVGRSNYINNSALHFNSIATPELTISHNVTINGIRLNDLITSTNKTQIVYGKKYFKHLSMSRLDLANPTVQLNEVNISRIAKQAIRLRDAPGNARSPQSYQVLRGNHVTFTRPVYVKRLIIDNKINSHINLTSLIYDTVKKFDINVQQISGLKHFLQPLKISRLTTDGTINGIQLNQVFNLNPIPPVSDYARYLNSSIPLPDIPIVGEYRFEREVDVYGNMDAGLVNGIDIARLAVRRTPQVATRGQQSPPQIIFGHKFFASSSPLRILETVKLIDPNEISALTGNISSSLRPLFPLVNGLDLSRINKGFSSYMQSPPIIHVENLEIEGNFDLPTSQTSNNYSQATFGSYSFCPLHVISSKLVLAGGADQVIGIPIKVGSLRARSVSFEPGALNGFNFPADFVLRAPQAGQAMQQPHVEPVFGRKHFEQLSVAPAFVPNNGPQQSGNGLIQVDQGANINSVGFGQLQTFVSHERQRNSTGENLFNTLNVYGSIYARRINGYYWPEDILLKSATMERTSAHKRIYSPLVFANSSDLRVENQLVLRGPIQLRGRMNGVNLTEFASQSATYGDKELLSINRPIRNKIFLGGLTVRGEIRSQGLIDGVDLEQMKNRVVTTGPATRRISIRSPKRFSSDVFFANAVSMVYLNDLPLNQFLRKIRFDSDGVTIRVAKKKTITGALRINRNLFVHGLINGINFVDLKARAISLSPRQNHLTFNKTLTVEGDVFMDNLLVDEQNGIIDGMRLNSLVPIHNGKTVSIRYEPKVRQKRGLIRLEPENRHPQLVVSQLDLLRKQIVSLSLIRINHISELVVGFIEGTTNDIASYQLPEQDLPHTDHIINPVSYLQLDQIDYPFRPTMYHLSVGVRTNQGFSNVTSVTTLIGNHIHELSVLPVESPNTAMFLPIGDALFLLISQDYTIQAGQNTLCPANSQQLPVHINDLTHLGYKFGGEQISSQIESGIHVYLFHVLQNSSSLTSAYFDLYQTIDLPQIDTFEKFTYNGSTYVLAISRSTARVYVLLPRGYSGFQVVSFIDAPLVESVQVMYTSAHKPVLIVRQLNGLYRLMESVII